MKKHSLVFFFFLLIWAPTKAFTGAGPTEDSAYWQLLIIRNSTYQGVKAVWKVGDPIRYALKDTNYYGLKGPVLLDGTVTRLDEKGVEINSKYHHLTEFHSLGPLTKKGKIPKRKIGLGILLIIFGFYGSLAIAALIEFTTGGSTLATILFGLLFGLTIFGSVRIFSKKFTYDQKKYSYILTKDAKEWKKGQSFSGMDKLNKKYP